MLMLEALSGMLGLLLVFCLFLLSAKVRLLYWVVVGCMLVSKGYIGRVAQYGLLIGFRFQSLLSEGCCVVSLSARIEHQPPKLGVEGSNPSPPAIDKPRQLPGMFICAS